MEFDASMESVINEMAAMFITDVHSELPSAKVNAGAKSKESIKLELQESAYNDALSPISRELASQVSQWMVS